LRVTTQPVKYRPLESRELQGWQRYDEREIH